MTIECYAVVGNPIDHSLSPDIHLAFAKSIHKSIQYARLGVTSHFEARVCQFFDEGGKGLNITAPFKIQAFEMSDVKTPRCQLALSANMLWMENGQIYADNTDGIGLCRALKKHMLLRFARVLIIGAGGAARGIVPALLEEEAEVIVTNRTFKKAQSLCEQFPDAQLLRVDAPQPLFDVVIHAAQHDLLNAQQWPLQWLQHRPYCYDLVYSKNGNTPFTRWADAHQCSSSDGFSMLVEQAREAFTIWHGVRPGIEITR